MNEGYILKCSLPEGELEIPVEFELTPTSAYWGEGGKTIFEATILCGSINGFDLDRAMLIAICGRGPVESLEIHIANQEG